MVRADSLAASCLLSIARQRFLARLVVSNALMMMRSDFLNSSLLILFKPYRLFFKSWVDVCLLHRWGSLLVAAETANIHLVPGLMLSFNYTTKSRLCVEERVHLTQQSHIRLLVGSRFVWPPLCIAIYLPHKSSSIHFLHRHPIQLLEVLFDLRLTQFLWSLEGQYCLTNFLGGAHQCQRFFHKFGILSRPLNFVCWNLASNTRLTLSPAGFRKKFLRSCLSLAIRKQFAGILDIDI